MERNNSVPDALGSRSSCLDSELEGNEAAEPTARSLLDNLPASKAKFESDLQEFCAARGFVYFLFLHIAPQLFWLTSILSPALRSIFGPQRAIEWSTSSTFFKG